MQSKQNSIENFIHIDQVKDGKLELRSERKKSIIE